MGPRRGTKARLPVLLHAIGQISGFMAKQGDDVRLAIYEISEFMGDTEGWLVSEALDYLKPLLLVSEGDSGTTYCIDPESRPQLLELVQAATTYARLVYAHKYSVV